MFRLGNAVVLTVAAGALAFAGAGTASADSGAQGVAYGSPGVLSGNVVQIPISIPINACGNSVNVLALLNPAAGNTCVNGGHGRQQHHDGGMKHEDKKDWEHKADHGKYSHR
ncbi:chaplin [Streptomyces sp. NBC_00876]|uniref:chaplin n=1 Tax=Streptomyces sp. NBC_00876 TaxID=2975853 RepID=UPI00386C04E6|nr:chaplin [Streptomyces sp. NBC_00876]